jgi:hypothetical protein
MLCMRFLGAISNTGRGSYANEAERLTGKVLERLRYDRIDEILRGGLHGYLPELIGMFNIIGQSIAQTYFYYRSISGALRANRGAVQTAPLAFRGRLLASQPRAVRTGQEAWQTTSYAIAQGR